MLRAAMFFVVATSVVATPDCAIGGLIGAGSWTRMSDDGRYLLVMIYTGSTSPDLPDPDREELTKKYGKSGVYRLEGSQARLLWEMPYQSIAYHDFLSADASHLLLTVPPNHGISDVSYWGALHFYHRNRAPEHWMEYEVTRGYFAKLLIQLLLNDKQWHTWTDEKFDPVENTYTITTSFGEKHVFDLTTGKTVSTRSAWDAAVVLILVGVPLLFSAYGRYIAAHSTISHRQAGWQLSMAEMLLIAAVVSVLLAIGKYSVILATAVAVIGFVGGGLAQFVQRGRAAWWLGGFAAVYGTLVGMIVFGTMGGAAIVCWELPSEVATGLLAVCCVSGWLMGAWAGGRLARWREQNTALVEAMNSGTRRRASE
jgi:hypothetical protein